MGSRGLRLAVAIVMVVASLVVPLGAGAFHQSNDNFEDAERFQALPFASAQDVSEATVQAGEPQPTKDPSTATACQEIERTVWFRYTPIADVNGAALRTEPLMGQEYAPGLLPTGLSVSALSDFAVGMRVYVTPASHTGPPSAVAASEGGAHLQCVNPGRRLILSAFPQANFSTGWSPTAYWIQVGRIKGSGGGSRLHVVMNRTIANDSIAEPILIVKGLELIGPSLTATREAYELSSSGFSTIGGGLPDWPEALGRCDSDNSIGSTLWYRYSVVREDQVGVPVTVNTAGSFDAFANNLDTIVNVWRFDNAPLPLIGSHSGPIPQPHICNDNDGSLSTSEVTFTPTELFQQFYIQIGGKKGEGGVIRVSFK